MKFSASTILLLPFTILASPVPENSAPAPVPAEEGSEVSDATLATRDIFARSTQSCKIMNVNDYANCRTGPSTSYPAPWRALKGVAYQFTCYEKGECFDGNCTWDKLVWAEGHCYVNGYFTDNHCTVASLGSC